MNTEENKEYEQFRCLQQFVLDFDHNAIENSQLASFVYLTGYCMYRYMLHSTYSYIVATMNRFNISKFLINTCMYTHQL